MTGIRNGAYVAWRYLMVLFVVVVVVQFFLAGVGVFGASDFDAHQGLGFLGTMVGSLLLLLLALIAWRDRVTTIGAVVLFVLAAIIQPSLATYEHPWVGAFHPLNGLIIFGLSGWLMGRAWRAHGGQVRRAEPMPTPPPPA